MQNFIELYELLMPCSQFAQKCFHFQEITKTSKCSESHRTLCQWYFATGQYYNMSFKTIAQRFDGVFWWFPALSEDQERKKNCRIHQNYLVALIPNIILNWNSSYLNVIRSIHFTVFCSVGIKSYMSISSQIKDKHRISSQIKDKHRIRFYFQFIWKYLYKDFFLQVHVYVCTCVCVNKDVS